jgi:hypothetical protein
MGAILTYRLSLAENKRLDKGGLPNGCLRVNVFDENDPGSVGEQ